jgi:hypothetical membrane protein
MFLNSKNVRIWQLLKVVPWPYWGLFSVIIGLLGDLISFIMYPNYNLTLMVSDLGTGPGGVFFNLGTILSGIFALLFYIYLGPHLKVENVNVRIHKIAMTLAILSCIFFIFIGIFPSMRSNSVLFILHGTTAVICWICGIGYLSLFGILIYKSDKFLRFHSYASYAVALIEIVFLFTWIPLIEWIMVFAISFWILFLTIYIFQNKEYFS